MPDLHDIAHHRDYSADRFDLHRLVQEVMLEKVWEPAT